MIDIKHTMNLFRENRITKISERMYEVDSHTVSIQIKQGRRVLTCSCENHSKFQIGTLCRHKEAAISYDLIKKFTDTIKEKSSKIKSLKYIKINKTSIDVILDELKDIEKLRF